MSKSPELDVDTTLSGDVAIVAGIPASRKLPTLEQVRGPGSPRRIPLALPETVVGRGTQANVTIDSSLLSRRHVVFKRSGPELTMTDLESQNGVYVNAVKASFAVLHEGDTIQVGDVVFVLHEAPV